MTSMSTRSRIAAIILAMPLLVLSVAAWEEEKDIDTIHTVYLTPIEGGKNAAVFQAVLKSELVHNGYSIVPKADGADAVLFVEVLVTKDGDKHSVETHASLENSAHNMVWSGGRVRSGPDLDRLLTAEARYLASAIRLAKDDLATKNQEKDKKKRPQQ